MMMMMILVQTDSAQATARLLRRLASQFRSSGTGTGADKTTDEQDATGTVEFVEAIEETNPSLAPLLPSQVQPTPSQAATPAQSQHQQPATPSQSPLSSLATADSV